ESPGRCRPEPNNNDMDYLRVGDHPDACGVWRSNLAISPRPTPRPATSYAPRNPRVFSCDTRWANLVTEMKRHTPSPDHRWARRTSLGRCVMSLKMCKQFGLVAVLWLGALLTSAGQITESRTADAASIQLVPGQSDR